MPPEDDEVLEVEDDVLDVDEALEDEVPDDDPVSAGVTGPSTTSRSEAPLTSAHAAKSDEPHAPATNAKRTRQRILAS